MAEELAIVNSNLLIKNSYKRDEDFLSDWKSRAKNDVFFLRRLTLIEELNKIKRLDLVLKILSDPDIKRLINRHPTTPLISRVTDDEQSNTNGRLWQGSQGNALVSVC